MKETPVIFSSEMVRANREHRKSMTRRLRGLEKVNAMPYLWESPFYSEEMGAWGFWQKNTGDIIYLKCPFGQVGDFIWVRETWFDNSFYPDDKDNVLYRADGEFQEQIPEEYDGAKWKPSIHMFRWASRDKYEITGLRVERLQEISPEDCLAEGIILPYRVFGDGDSEYFEAIEKAIISLNYGTLSMPRKDIVGTSIRGSGP